jgi:hypothetical protein
MLAEPQRRATDGKACAVAGVVGDRQLGNSLPLEKLAALVTAV